MYFCPGCVAKNDVTGDLRPHGPQCPCCNPCFPELLNAIRSRSWEEEWEKEVGKQEEK